MRTGGTWSALGAINTALPGTLVQSQRWIEGLAFSRLENCLAYRSIKAVRPRLQISMPAIKAAPMSIGT
jgi:hypothetical protein